MKIFLLFTTLFLGSVSSQAAEILVYDIQDTSNRGTLRGYLRAACDTPEDDRLRFAPQPGQAIHIHLQSPLVIPEDCEGKIILDGSWVDYRGVEHEGETILDGSGMASPCDPAVEDCLHPIPGSDRERIVRESRGGVTHGDSCILHVYSAKHAIRNLTFLGNTLGAGVCLFGPKNEITNNRFGKDARGNEVPNKYGIVVHDIFSLYGHPKLTGESNKILDNQIGPSLQHGVWGHANETLLENNFITQSRNAGVVLFGEKQQVKNNEAISQNGGHGIYTEGEDIQIMGNNINQNGGSGIWVVANDSTISDNRILANGGCFLGDPYSSHELDCLATEANSGAGIVLEDSRNVLIGGSDFGSQKNTIQYNHDGGVLVFGESEEILITHNQISLNYGTNVDLNGDGPTENDHQDDDEGPNTLFNYVEHFQIFPLRAGVYWGWGIAPNTPRLEMYADAAEAGMRRILDGGGDDFLTDAYPTDHVFEIYPSRLSDLEDRFVSMLNFDPQGNTSEFSPDVMVAPDADLDGIPDTVENNGPSGTNANSTDSDGDGLPDPIEDRNRNGVWDGGGARFIAPETNASDPDTDDDGLSDGAETHGDGVYDAGVDTNPFNPDTDGDMIPDGREDANNNGIWDSYARETSPLSTDSDGDHHPDNTDTCPSIANPGQEAWYCQ